MRHGQKKPYLEVEWGRCHRERRPPAVVVGSVVGVGSRRLRRGPWPERPLLPVVAVAAEGLRLLPLPDPVPLLDPLLQGRRNFLVALNSVLPAPSVSPAANAIN